jgi:hypothetical protein
VLLWSSKPRNEYRSWRKTSLKASMFKISRRQESRIKTDVRERDMMILGLVNNGFSSA